MAYPYNNHTETIIDDNCGISTFYAIANTLAEELRVIFLGREDDAESVDWEFQYKNSHLTLHYDIFNGVSISGSGKENEGNPELIHEVAKYLSSRSF